MASPCEDAWEMLLFHSLADPVRDSRAELLFWNECLSENFLTAVKYLSNSDSS